VIRRQTILNFQLIIGITLLCLLWAGLQAAHSCSAYDSCNYRPDIRVDRCHIEQNTTKIENCCKSEACHQTTPVQHDMGTPSYNNEQNISHFLIHESRVQSPQSKEGTRRPEFFRTMSTVLCQITPPEMQRQALASLRTVVLRN